MRKLRFYKPRQLSWNNFYLRNLPCILLGYFKSESIYENKLKLRMSEHYTPEGWAIR